MAAGCKGQERRRKGERHVTTQRQAAKARSGLGGIRSIPLKRWSILYNTVGLGVAPIPEFRYHARRLGRNDRLSCTTHHEFEFPCQGRATPVPNTGMGGRPMFRGEACVCCGTVNRQPNSNVRLSGRSYLGVYVSKGGVTPRTFNVSLVGIECIIAV